MRQRRTLFEDAGPWLLAMVLIGALVPTGASRAENGPFDDAWRALRDNPGDYEASQRLLYGFGAAHDTFDRRLRGTNEYERLLARQLLRDSIERLRAGWSVGDDARAADARTQLIEAATAWAQDPSPFLGATGRLLLIGHGAAGLGATIGTAIDDAERDPSGWPWLAWTLGQVVQDQPTFDQLPDTATDALLAQALRAPGKGRSRIGRAIDADPAVIGNVAQPVDEDLFAWLFRFGGSPVLEALDDATATDTASPTLRLELLRRVTERPWDMPPDRLVRLLEQPWLHQPRLDEAVQHLFVRLHEVLAGTRTAREVLREPLRLFVLRNAQCRLCWLDDRQPIRYEPAVLTLLTADDVKPMIEDREGVARWLWLLASIGGWAEITPDLEALLGAPTTAVPAALALAPLRHPRALDVLITQLLDGFELPGDALAPYGTSAGQRLEERAGEARPEARELVDLARVRLGGTSRLADALWRETETSFDMGALPGGLVAELLHESGHPVFERLVTVLAALPEGDRVAARWIYDLGPGFAHAFALWAGGRPDRSRQTAPVLQILDAPFWPEVLDWGQRLAATLLESDTGPGLPVP